jgi:rhodanese-related sulfurtransferase
MKRAFCLLAGFAALVTFISGCECTCMSAFGTSEKLLLDKNITAAQYITSAEIEEMTEKSPQEFLLVDLRTPEQFQEGTLKNAINLPVTEIFLPDNAEMIKHLGKTIVLYNNDMQNVHRTWFLLKQLEVPEVKIFVPESSNIQETTEEAQYDFAAVMQEAALSFKKENEIARPKPVAVPSAPKKVIPIAKKKPAAEEEGC